MSPFAKICSREIFEILSFAKISSGEMTKKFIRKNKFLRRLIPLKYSLRGRVAFYDQPFLGYGSYWFLDRKNKYQTILKIFSYKNNTVDL